MFISVQDGGWQTSVLIPQVIQLLIMFLVSQFSNLHFSGLAIPIWSRCAIKTKNTQAKAQMAHTHTHTEFVIDSVSFWAQKYSYIINFNIIFDKAVFEQRTMFNQFSTANALLYLIKYQKQKIASRLIK